MNVAVRLENPRRMPVVCATETAGTPRLSSLFYGIVTGRLLMLDEAANRFAPAESVLWGNSAHPITPVRPTGHNRAVDREVSLPRRRPSLRWPLLTAAAAWLALAVVAYGQLCLRVHLGWYFLGIDVLAGVLAIPLILVTGWELWRNWRLTGAVLACVGILLAGTVLVVTPWRWLYLWTRFTVHRADFATIATQSCRPQPVYDNTWGNYLHQCDLVLPATVR